MGMNSQILPNFAILQRAFRFGLVGIFVCGVDVGLVWLLSRCLSPALAVSLAYVSAVAIHYSLNKWWVFGNQDTAYLKQICRYSLTVLACWLCTLLVFMLALHYLTPVIVIAKLIAIPPSTLLGFGMMRAFVFRENSSKHHPEAATEVGPGSVAVSRPRPEVVGK